LLAWRSRFFSICNKFNIPPAAACIQFGISPPQIVSIALNSTKPNRTKQNIALLQTKIPNGFWKALEYENLIAKGYPFL
jgi:D-threo-aldose 1-dehydrogenase